jgi:hypothetical protein
VSGQKLELAKLTFGLSCFWKLGDVKLIELEVFEVFVHEAVAEIFFVGALSTLVHFVLLGWYSSATGMIVYHVVV